MTKLRKNLLIGLLTGMLAFTGVACDDGADDTTDDTTTDDTTTEDPLDEEMES